MGLEMRERSVSGGGLSERASERFLLPLAIRYTLYCTIGYVGRSSVVHVRDHPLLILIRYVWGSTVDIFHVDFGRSPNVAAV
jgi:hypothetical protein